MKRKNQFWIGVNGNFLDIAVLEWCKLFDRQGKHFWGKVVSDQNVFLRGLLERLGLSDVEFEKYVRQVRVYRDKFLAHLDDEERMEIPFLQTALDSACYLYDYLLDHEEIEGCFADNRGKSLQLYEESLALGNMNYEQSR